MTYQSLERNVDDETGRRIRVIQYSRHQLLDKRRNAKDLPRTAELQNDYIDFKT